MNKREKIWWLELADWFEAVAADPSAKFLYTCELMATKEWGWVQSGWDEYGYYHRLIHPADVFPPIWEQLFGSRDAYPIGVTPCFGREKPKNERTPDRVFDYCHEMAEFIREEVGDVS